MTPQGFAAIASMVHGVSIDDILSHKRHDRIVRARNTAFALARAGGWSLQEIGEAFNRHHTTVMHGLKKHKEKRVKIMPETHLSETDQKVLATFKPGKPYIAADIKARCRTYQKLNLGDGVHTVLNKLIKAGKIESLGEEGRHGSSPTVYMLKAEA